MKKLLIIFVCLLSSLCFSFNSDNINMLLNHTRQYSFDPIEPETFDYNSREIFQGLEKSLECKHILREMEPSELLEETEFILGYFNPDTVLIIDNDTTIHDQIILFNNAELRFEDANINWSGEIWLLGNSKLTVSNCNFNIPQEYIYQYTIVQIDSSSIEFRNNVISSNNYPWSLGSANNTSLIFENNDMNRSFITFALMDSSSYSIENTDFAGEFVVIGESCSLSTLDSDTLLVWLGFLKHSSGEIDFSYSSDDLVELLDFPNESCTGLNYSVNIRNCHNLRVAAMIEDSTDVTIRNCNLFACGNIFYTAVEETLNGFVNEMYYENWTPALEHRNLHLINSDCYAWNFYAYESSDIYMNSSIMGEFLATGNSKVFIENATCDGHGGHLGVSDSAEMAMFLSTSFTDILLENKGTAIFALCSIIGFGRLICENSSICVLYSTYLENEPIVLDSSTIIVIDLDTPMPARINDNLQINGSSRLIKGPESPFIYEGYRLTMASSLDEEVILFDSGRLTDSVNEDELCSISTLDYETGDYLLKLFLFFNYGGFGTDSISFDKELYLSYYESIEETSSSEESLTFYPNPIFDGSTVYFENTNNFRSIEIFDISGKLQFHQNIQNKPNISFSLSVMPGVYIVRMQGTEDTSIRKILVQ